MSPSKYFLNACLFVCGLSLFLKCNLDIEKFLITQEYNQSPYKAYILSKVQNLTYKMLVIEKSGMTVYNQKLDQALFKIVDISNDTITVEYYAKAGSSIYANGTSYTVIKYDFRNVKGSIAVHERKVDSISQVNSNYHFFYGKEVDTVDLNSLEFTGSYFFKRIYSDQILISTKYIITDHVFIDKFYSKKGDSF